MESVLNENELLVLNECKRVAIKYGDNGSEFCFDALEVPKMTKQQLKGYLSQLIQKKLIDKLNGCYFDFEII